MSEGNSELHSSNSGLEKGLERKMELNQDGKVFGDGLKIFEELGHGQTCNDSIGNLDANGKGASVVNGNTKLEQEFIDKVNLQINLTNYEVKDRLLKEQLPIKLASRQKCVLILILKSLNGSFDTKYLNIPFKPDGLKLGRPVAASNTNASTNSNNNNNSNNNDSNKNNMNNNSNDSNKNKNSNNNDNINNNHLLENGNGINKNEGDKGSQQMPMIKPDTGYFDSRVLSRNHAVLHCDPSNCKIYIRDLKSSNGTFLNGERIKANESYPIKVGDVIDLGTDIDNKTEHKKISAFVEDISFIPLLSTSGDTSYTNNGHDINSTEDYGIMPYRNENSLTKYYEEKNSIKSSFVKPSVTTLAAYESNILGYNNNLNIEDTILGVETELLSGIYVNNSMGTSSELINVLKLLATEISLKKHERLACKSVETYIKSFISNMEYLKKINIDKNDNHLAKIQAKLKKILTTEYENQMEQYQKVVDQFENEMDNLKSNINLKKLEHNENMVILRNEIEDLKTRKEVKNYKKSQLDKLRSKTPEHDKRINLSDGNLTSKDTILGIELNNNALNKSFMEDEESKMKSLGSNLNAFSTSPLGKIVLIGSVSVVLLGMLFKHIS